MTVVARDVIEAIRGRRIAGNPFASVNVQNYPNADPTALNDSSAAFLAAFNDLGAAGGIINFIGWYYVDPDFTIPENIILNGVAPNVGRTIDGSYKPSNIPSALIFNPLKTHILSSRAAIRNCLIIHPNLIPGGTYALPHANAAIAANAVAAFSGTFIIPASTSYDHGLENLVVLGYNYIYDGRAAAVLNRPLFKRVYGDVINGIAVNNVQEIGRAEDCECWEFTTAQFANSTGLNLRSGTAYYTTGNSTWMKWEDCFEFGYAIGHDVDGCQDVRQVSCGADSPSTAVVAHTNMGFRYRNSMADVVSMQCTATNQGDAGFVVNPSVQNNVNDVKIIAPNIHSNGAVNGHIHMQQGTCTVLGAHMSLNGATGAVQVDAGLAKGALKLIGCTFAQMGAGQAVFGDATSILNTRIIAPTYTGNSTCTQGLLDTWTPAISFGGGTTGITYGTQAGSYSIDGDLITLHGKLILTSKGSSVGTAKITGLPYAIASVTGNHGGGAPSQTTNFTGLTGAIQLTGNEGTTEIILRQTDATGASAIDDTVFTNTTSIYFTVSYFV